MQIYVKNNINMHRMKNDCLKGNPVDDGIEDDVHRILDAGNRGVDFHIGVLRCFERGGDPRKVLDFTCTCPFVEALYIARFTYRQGWVEEDLDEVFLPDDLAGHVTDLVGGTDEGADGDHPGIDEQLGDLCNAPDILQPVFFAEAQVVINPGTDVIPVQHLAEEPVKEEFLLQV